MYTGKRWGRHGKEGHDAFHKLLAEGKQGETKLLPYFRDTLQYEKYDRHGKEGHDALHKLLADGRPGEAKLLLYFRDTLQYEKYGRRIHV